MRNKYAKWGYQEYHILIFFLGVIFGLLSPQTTSSLHRVYFLAKKKKKKKKNRMGPWSRNKRDKNKKTNTNSTTRRTFRHKEMSVRDARKEQLSGGLQVNMEIVFRKAEEARQQKADEKAAARAQKRAEKEGRGTVVLVEDNAPPKKASDQPRVGMIDFEEVRKRAQQVFGK